MGYMVPPRPGDPEYATILRRQQRVHLWQMATTLLLFPALVFFVLTWFLP